MADIFAVSLLLKLSLEGRAIVEFSSAEMAEETVGKLKGIALFPFSVAKTKKGFIRLEKLEVIL